MDQTTYNVRVLSGPIATGFLLVAVNFIIKYFGRITGLSYKIMKDSNLLLLRSQYLLQPPTFYPLPDELKEPACPMGHICDIKPIISVPNPSPKSESVFSFTTSEDFHLAYKNKLTTPTKVAKILIDLVEKSKSLSRPLNALVKCDYADVLKQAAESTRRYEEGKPLSVLDGVPVSIKDEAAMLPYKTSLGTGFLNIVAEDDAHSVGLFRAAGCLLIGKASMHEVGIDITNCNPNTGTPRNPYNLGYYTGGSSGGSACSVAAGLCPISLGADGGGSIRIPASLCGVYGLKPTAFRISAAGSFPICATNGVVGPIASNAKDLALAYAFTAGPNKYDVLSWKQPKPTVASFGNVESLKGLKIGIHHEYFKHADKQVVDACYAFVEKLKSKGAEIIDITIPKLEELRVAHLNTIISEMLAGLADFDRNKFALPTQLNLNVAEQTLGPRDYIDGLKFRTVGMSSLRSLFRKVDLIVTPTCGQTAPKISDDALLKGLSDINCTGRVMRFIFICNFLGLPGLSVPIGYDSKGLPIGFQFMAKWWNEDLLLRMAHVSEILTGVGSTRKPEVYYDLLK